ncbi:hypothetical protein BHE18_11805 [Rossellomorea aquimaris]|uniref:Uncharacterized protein n=1 Tax=Rossellomorea aquimaris TaxID=189382 RepID=A0A1J6W1B9_9BACI|nr:hypothetical protein BHE18_11805 [Rossellomorea aquimaris]
MGIEEGEGFSRVWGSLGVSSGHRILVYQQYLGVINKNWDLPTKTSRLPTIFSVYQQKCRGYRQFFKKRQISLCET